MNTHAKIDKKCKIKFVHFKEIDLLLECFVKNSLDTRVFNIFSNSIFLKLCSSDSSETASRKKFYSTFLVYCY